MAKKSKPTPILRAALRIRNQKLPAAAGYGGQTKGCSSAARNMTNAASGADGVSGDVVFVGTVFDPFATTITPMARRRKWISRSHLQEKRAAPSPGLSFMGPIRP